MKLFAALVGLSFLSFSFGAAPTVTESLVVDLDANHGITIADGDRVEKWTNQVITSAARDFVKQDEGRDIAGSGRPTLLTNVERIGGHNSLLFIRQELVNHEEDVFDHLITGSGYTWFAVMCVYEQADQLKDVNSFFGNLRNSDHYEGFWGNVTDDNRLWIGSRNAITFGRWDENNPMVLAEKPLETHRYYVIAGRMGSGPGEVLIEAFVNDSTPVAVAPFPVNPKGNSSKLAIGQERDAVNHPGWESFDGEIARFMLYERPLSNNELTHVIQELKQRYHLK